MSAISTALQTRVIQTPPPTFQVRDSTTAPLPSHDNARKHSLHVAWSYLRTNERLIIAHITFFANYLASGRYSRLARFVEYLAFPFLPGHAPVYFTLRNARLDGTGAATSRSLRTRKAYQRRLALLATGSRSPAYAWTTPRPRAQMNPYSLITYRILLIVTFLLSELGSIFLLPFPCRVVDNLHTPPD